MSTSSLASELAALLEDKLGDAISEAVADHDFSDAAEEAISEAAREYDFDDAIGDAVSEYNFDKAIKLAVSDYDFDDAIREAVDNVVEGYDFEPAITQAVDAHDFRETVDARLAALAETVDALRACCDTQATRLFQLDARLAALESRPSLWARLARVVRGMPVSR